MKNNCIALIFCAILPVCSFAFDITTELPQTVFNMVLAASDDPTTVDLVVDNSLVDQFNTILGGTKGQDFFNENAGRIVYKVSIAHSTATNLVEVEVAFGDSDITTATYTGASITETASSLQGHGSAYAFYQPGKDATHWAYVTRSSGVRLRMEIYAIIPSNMNPPQLTAPVTP